jgi:hypothetical protein
VKDHPEWFTWRPDGTAQYAENPPKKYQDVVPFNFGNRRLEKSLAGIKRAFLIIGLNKALKFSAWITRILNRFIIGNG